MPISRAGLLDEIVEQYLTSADFNGLPAYAFVAHHGCTMAELKEALADLVRSGDVTVLFGEIQTNPHIRAFTDEPADSQLEHLTKTDSDSVVAYPTPRVLSQRVSETQYISTPYKRRLALGEPQLGYACFDPVVLDPYRRDPRYDIWWNDIQGTLSIGNEAYESPDFPERDKISLQSFGFAFDANWRRAVAVFLIDLARLTPEHQQLWAAREVSGEFKLHPDFYGAMINADFDIKASLTDAFIEERRVINQMCELIGWKPLFTGDAGAKPQDFAFMLIPTGAEIESFIMLLDKLMSDSINCDCFPPAIPRFNEVDHGNNRIEMVRRGSIALLKDWLDRSFRTKDREPLDDMIATFKDIRKRRSKPAHALNDNRYDPALFEEQRELLIKAYEAMRTLRLLLANLPKAKSAIESMDERVRVGDIWFM